MIPENTFALPDRSADVLTRLEAVEALLRQLAAERERLLSIGDVAAKVGLSTSTVYGLIREGTFPRGIEVGPRLRRWSERAVDAWIAELKAAQARPAEPEPDPEPDALVDDPPDPMSHPWRTAS